MLKSQIFKPLSAMLLTVGMTFEMIHLWLINNSRKLFIPGPSSKIMLNSYTNIIEKSSGSNPKTFGINFENTAVQSFKDMVNSYRNHPSVIKIKQVVNGSDISESERFSINENEIKNLLRNLDLKRRVTLRQELLNL